MSEHGLYHERYHTPRMKVAAPLDQAWAHMKRLLFPFDVMVWLRFGFILFLETLVQGGMGISLPGGPGENGIPNNMSKTINGWSEWVTSHLAPILAIGIPALMAMAGLIVLFAWLGSRGQLMAVRAVALNDSFIGTNWRETKALAHSLFLFRVVFSFITMAVGLIFLVAACVIVLTLAKRGEPEILQYVFKLLPLFLVALCVAMVWWLINTMLRNFVAPLMFRRNISCMEAWREFQELANVNKWPLFLFIHIRAFYWIGIVTAALAGGCLTCCVGFLPVVSHAILSPLLVFDRAYGLYVIESMGLEYQIVQPHAELDAVFDTEPAGTAQDTPVETVEDTHEPPDEHIS